MIVASILLAFAIDAWWEGVRERSVEQSHIEALAADVAESLRLLEENSAGFSTMRTSLARLLESDLESEPVDSIAYWIRAGLFELWPYEPRLSSLADLEASDDMARMSPEVRRQISGVVRALADLERMQDDLADSQISLIDPFLVDNVPLASVMAERLGLTVPEQLTDVRNWSFLGSAEARNRMVVKLSIIGYLSPRRETLLLELRSLQSLLDARTEELR